MSRSDQLRTVAEEFCKVHDDWQGDRKRPHPDGQYWEAVDNLTSAFATGDVPEDSRELAESVQAFALEAQEFDDRDNPADNPDPPSSFWAAREKVAAVLDGNGPSRQIKPLETLANLRLLPGINDMQIARIYHFYDRRRNLMPQLVQQELDKPGSVLKTPGAMDGRDWVNPHIPRPTGNDPANRIATKVSEKRKAEAKKSPPCPESPKDLWEQRVSVSQSAKMLQKPESEVAALFAQFDQEHEDALSSGEVSSDKTQYIRELKASGKSNKAIAEELKVSLKDVVKALEGAKAE